LLFQFQTCLSKLNYFIIENYFIIIATTFRSWVKELRKKWALALELLKSNNWLFVNG